MKPRRQWRLAPVRAPGPRPGRRRVARPARSRTASAFSLPSPFLSSFFRATAALAISAASTTPSRFASNACWRGRRGETHALGAGRWGAWFLGHQIHRRHTQGQRQGNDCLVHGLIWLKLCWKVNLVAASTSIPTRASCRREPTFRRSVSKTGLRSRVKSCGCRTKTDHPPPPCLSRANLVHACRLTVFLDRYNPPCGQ